MDQHDIEEFDPNNFELPEAMFVDEGQPLLYEFEENRFALFTFFRTEVAELALEIAQGFGLIAEKATVKQILPNEWAGIVREIGPTLAEVMLVYRVVEGGNLFHRVAILDFLRRARRITALLTE